MKDLTRRESDRLTVIRTELSTIRTAAPDAVARVLPEIRELAELDSVHVYALRELDGAWGSHSSTSSR
jgi:hypothetical protein